MTAKDKKNKYAYVERDLSWMYFNRRILQEAARPEVPLLERLSFLGIYSNNLDEFFRVRMATLGRIAECDVLVDNHRADYQRVDRYKKEKRHINQTKYSSWAMQRASRGSCLRARRCWPPSAEVLQR